LSQLLSYIKGNKTFVQIAKKVSLVGLEECKNHLHGCILLTKGDNRTHLELCKKLKVTWKHFGQWKAIPAGKGVCEFAFSSLKRHEKGFSYWNFKFISWHSSCFCLDKRFYLGFYQTHENSIFGILAIESDFLNNTRDWYIFIF